MANQIIKTFTSDATWTAPAGVTQLRVSYSTSFTNLPERPYTALNMNLLVDSNQQAYAWGNNATYGMLGVGDITSRSSPVLVLGSDRFVKMYVGFNGASNYGITSEGNIYSMGFNTGGVLGDGTIVHKSSPVAVLGGLTFTDFTVDYARAFGITNTGDAYAWGQNATGQLGVGDVVSRSSPVLVSGGLKFQKIYTVPNQSMFGLTTSGQLYAWGANTQGQLGVGDVVARSSPVLVLGGLTFKNVFTCININSVYGLTTSGDLYAWGINGSGQLGVGDVVARSSPVLVLGGLKFKKVFVGAQYAWGITNDGNMYAWGSNLSGELGLGDTISRSSPVLYTGGLKFTKGKASTIPASYGITENGTLYAWGAGSNYVLGNGDINPRSSPVAVAGGVKFSDVAILLNGIFGISTDGTLYSWGSGTQGVLGNGSTIARSTPAAVLGGLTFPMETRTTQSTQLISVVPGTSYSINMSNYNTLFGTQCIGTGGDNKQVTLEYYA